MASENVEKMTSKTITLLCDVVYKMFLVETSAVSRWDTRRRHYVHYRQLVRHHWGGG
jgi:hypothetical protein